jgi:oligoendopeptidase F
MTQQSIPERDTIPVADRWDLSLLFATEEEWDRLFGEVEKGLAEYERLRGRLADSAEALGTAIEIHLDLMRRLDRITTYAHLKNDEDRSNQRCLGLHQRAVGLSARLAQAASFMTPEIQAIPAPVMDSFLATAALQPHRFHLEKILRYRPHTRTAAEEQLLAMSREMAAGASQAFGQLDNADLRFGRLADGSGREVELSHGNFMRFMLSRNRDLRREAFHRYYRAYDDHRNTLAALLAASVRHDVFYARARAFPSCRARALFADNVPEAVYDRLVATVRAGLGLVVDYFEFRRRALGLSELHVYDTYVPIAEQTEVRLTYEEAVEVCAEALAPLGADYTAEMRKGLLGGWVDRFENRGKRSGAYASGCYDSPPYILLNYDAHTITSVFTLAHEAGHAMHSLYARRHQPYADHDYTIFVAEVASTFNEALLTRHLLRTHRGDARMRRYLLTREIDAIRATLVRQTMFAEFEQEVHRLAEENRPLTLETLTGVYRGLLEVYFGGAVTLDEVLALECLRIPHFYSAFYVFQYATGISAALALAGEVAAGEPGARERYLGFLKLGGSRFPLDELIAAGVDMRTPEPVERALAHLGGLVEELKGMG